MAANTLLTPTIIAKAAVRILNNELNVASKVFRGYEDEFAKTYNGYKVGQTVNIRKPQQFTVRSGATASIQNVIEGYTQITVNRQRGIDFNFTSSELTLSIGELSERVLRPAMVRLANQIDVDVLSLYSNVWNWVGTPANTMGGFDDMARAGQRLDEMAVPTDDRYAFLSPADYWGMVNNLTGLYIQSDARAGYRDGNLGPVAGMDTFRAQNVQTLTTGSRTNGTVSGAGQAVTYSGSQANSWTQTLNVTGCGNTATVAAGDVFTIATVYAVNPVTKAPLPYLQQFVVTSAITLNSSGAGALTISPAIIPSGAFQTVSYAADPNGQAVTWLGAASTGFSQNMAFHKNAFALAVVPMELPPGAVNPARESYEGLSVRVVPYYDGTNDQANWRLDCLYGVAAIDPRLATRISG